MKFTLSLFILVFSVQSFASNPVFTNLGFEQKNFDSISEDLTAAFSHTTNSGAKSLGKIFGIEAGLVFGVVRSKSLQEVAENLSGSSQDELKYLPSAGIVAGVALPMGIGAELSFIPSVDVSDVAFSNTSLGLRWNITDIFPIVGSLSPLKLVTRLSYGVAELDYNFSLSGIDKEETEMSLKTLELGILAGVSLFVVEPYLGLSYVRSDSEVDATATITPPVGPATVEKANFKSDLTTQKITAGVLFKLPFFRIGVEYANLKGISRYTAKLSLKF